MASYLAKHRFRFVNRRCHLTKRRFHALLIRSLQAHSPLVQASLVDLFELRRPVLGQEIELPLYATTIAT